MARSKIEWLARPGTIPESWNIVTGCNKDGKRIKISPGCDHCWAERMARRLAGRYGYPPMPHHFDVTLHPGRLEQPLRWRKPRTIFVCSMSDLFHREIALSFVRQVWDVMADCPNHTFIVLTKRVRSMNDTVRTLRRQRYDLGLPSPLPNVWLGVTAENQEMADERIPFLLQTPAAVRFVSVEPTLGAIDLSPYLGFVPTKLWPTMTSDEANQWIDERNWLDWVIAGGESGPGARPAHPDWFRGLRDQCQAAGVAFFFKQWGTWMPTTTLGPDYDADYNYLLDDGQWMFRAGKKIAGRLLDGREWNEWPGAKEG